MAKKEGVCESCGRYVGAYNICPYCGARMNERVSVRALKIFSLVFTVIGVLAVYLVARNTELNEVSVASIEEDMNYAVACVNGIVSRPPSINKETKTLSFWIEDSTGDIRVASYRKDAENIQAAGKVPLIGDSVKVCGTIRVVGGSPYIILNAPDKISIFPPQEPKEMAIAEITETNIGDYIKTTGVVIGIRETKGPLIITLRDLMGDQKISAPIYPDQFTPPEMGEMDTLQISGIVNVYKGDLQINPRDSSSLKIVGKAKKITAAEAPVTKISNVKSNMVGQKVKVRGTIGRVTKVNKGRLVNIYDNTGKITVVIWDRVYQYMSDQKLLEAGNNMEVFGRIEKYKDQLEIIPEGPEHLDLTKGEKTANSQTQQKVQAKKVDISTISEEMVGQQVKITGKVENILKLSKGRLITVSDGTGKIPLLLWDKQYKYVKNKQDLDKGAEIEASGEVILYKDKLELEIKRGENLIVTKGAAGAKAETVNIGSITKNMEGEKVSISGKVDKITKIKGARLINVSDGTGDIPLLISDKAFNYVKNKEQLDEGSKVEVTGSVFLYKGEKVELKVSRGEHLKVISEGKAEVSKQLPVSSIAEVKEQKLGTWVRIKATVTKINELDKGRCLLTLKDDTGDIAVYLWESIWADCKEDVTKGAELFVSGKLDKYKDLLEIIPAKTTDIKVVK